VVLLYVLFNEIALSGFRDYQSYFVITIECFAAWQIIKSGRSGLLLATAALIVGGVAAHQLGYHETLFHMGRQFYQYLMIVGIIGLGVSVFSMG